MKFKVTFQNPLKYEQAPNRFLIQRWVNETLRHRCNRSELTIRIVDELESASLNKEFRNKATPTNVLSFPYDIPEEVSGEYPLLGDLVICAPVIQREAIEQCKSEESHWAHMIIHGLLHLLGYDHQTDQDALLMENLEIELLNKLGFPNPYFEEREDPQNDE